jgi:hypothetical protein
VTMKLPRTIRLDPSDTLIFERPAEPGEWAVTGSFLFWDADIPGLTGKARAAFRAGFLGVRSFGFSTLVVVSEASQEERDEAIEILARRLHTELGAPDMPAALAAASEEIAFAASLCQSEVNTLIAMHRTLERDDIKEQFRTLCSRNDRISGADHLHAHARAFELIEIDDGFEEDVDLARLTGRARP